MNQKEAFFKHLIAMEVDLLDGLLDDSISYFGASKKVFLEKLTYIFSQIKLSGKKGVLKIKAHKSRANAFYLKFSGLSLRSEFCIEEQDGVITKLERFKSNLSHEEIEELGPFEFYFGEDERIGFVPSAEYTATLAKCTSAHAELSGDQIYTLSSTDLSRWINAHKALYQSVQNESHFFKFNPFRDLYLGLEILHEHISHYQEVKEAMDTLQPSNLIKTGFWLKKYYDLYVCKILMYDSYFYEIDHENKLFKYNKNLHFVGEEFKTTYDFLRTYAKHYDLYIYWPVGS